MKTADDFQWPNYTADYYKRETEDAYARGETFLIKDSTVEDGKIIFRDNVHPHIKRLLEHINEVQPTNVIECGCGGGHNVFNILKLLHIPTVGFDLLRTQIEEMGDYLGIRESVLGNVGVMDLCEPVGDEDYAEYVFTNAVLMHLPHAKAVRFSANMGKMSRKYIRITEDLGQHDFPEIFKEAGVLRDFKIISSEDCVMILRRKDNAD